MPLEPSMEEFDLVVVRRAATGAYVIAQRVDGRNEVIEAAPLTADDAQARAIALAEAHGADAWFEDHPGHVRLLA